MSKQSHTPGPWTASGTQVCTWTKENYVTNVPFTYDPPLPAPSRQWTEKLINEAKANARLIAAAPELLEEHIKTLAWLKHIYPQIRERMSISVILGFDQAIKATEDAIAKARGES